MADQWGERMPRSVSLLQTVAVSVGVAIGSGIFRVPATVAAQLHAPGPIIACWVLGGIIALCGALTVAEPAAALPRSGCILASLLASALIPVLGPYDGWADPATMAGEVSDPQRTLAPALIAGALCVMLVCLVVNIGFMYALAPAQMAGSQLIASSVAARIPLLGGAGAAVVAAAVMVSAFSGLNASMMTGSRVV